MPTKEQRAEIKWAVSKLGGKQPDYRKHLDYYNGNHQLMIHEDRLEKVFRGMFKSFRLNLCVAVVDALVDRLQIQSFSAGDDETLSDEAWDIWKKNRMMRRSGSVHQTAIAGADTYVLVWPNAAGYPTLYPNSPLNVTVEYDPESPGVITKAAKLWKEGGNHYLNLYYPNRIEKYMTDRSELVGSALNAQNFRARQVPGEAWPLVNQYNKVPVFHFANNADLAEFGTSELRDAIDVQDGLNKTVLDMLVNGEYQAYPQRYALNIEVKRDHEGNPINPFRAGAERVWVLNGGENTQLGEFQAADSAKTVAVKQDWALSMSQVTMTPPHYFMLPSGIVSGESQKTAEQKLDAKVTDRTIAFGETWADIMAFAMGILRGDSVDGLELDTNWKDTKPRNELEEWQKAVIKEEMGVSRRQILLEQGYTEEQIDQFEEDKAKEAQERAALAPAIPGGLRLDDDESDEEGPP